MKLKHLIILSFLFISFNLPAKEILRSPNGNLRLDFTLTNQGEPQYGLKFKDKAVILPSKLGIEIVDDTYSLFNHFEWQETNESATDETWKPVLGQYAQIRSQYNEAEVVLYQKDRDTKLVIRFRLFNDGLGFRYEFPKQPNLNYFIIKEENTEFRLTGDHKAFWLPGDYNTEEYRTSTTLLSGVKPKLDSHTLFSGESYNLWEHLDILAVQSPLMMKTAEGLYINIHEAALINYSAMQLLLDDQNFILKTHLAPDAQGNKGHIQTDHQSPWRTIMVSDDARDILASSLILNLNEPTAYKDTDWIKPVKYVGVWWQYFVKGSTWAYTDETNTKLGITDYSKLIPNKTHGATTENVIKHIDFAAKHGFDQVLVEGWNEGWEDWFGLSKEEVFDFVTPYPDFDLVKIREHAKSKGVKVMMHHETSASATNYERRLADAFQFMADNNYSAVKTGYVGYPIPRGEWRSGQWMGNHYRRVADMAAKYKISVNSHEAVRPTGLFRTYPNWLAQESARGTEFEAMGGSDPDHTTILPFTRLVGGPMDYTPGIFQTQMSYYDPTNTNRVHTTLTKQLALYITMYSPLQMAADWIENYERFPDAFQFIKDVALDWDNTWILEAEPGDYISIARKTKGKNEWFIGSISDENPRTATLDFSFLPPGKDFEAIIYEDGKDADWDTNPMVYNIRTIKVNNKTVLKQNIAPGGGTAIHIR